VPDEVGGEEALQGGNLSIGVVRTGSEVHRPVGPWTPAVHALLAHLDRAGFAGAPRVLGFDEIGREVVEYLEGPVPWGLDHHSLLGTPEAVHRVGRLLRSFHDAVVDFEPDPALVWRYPEMRGDAMAYLDDRGIIVCHNDPTAWNLVVGSDRWAFIDWDASGPRPPIWDVAYCAIGVVPMRLDTEELGWSGPVPVASRLRALGEGYRLGRDDLGRLPEVVVARIRSSYTHARRRAEAGIAPWDSLWRRGHGDAWAAMLRFASANAEQWSRELRRP
jgi:hypothetical protein